MSSIAIAYIFILLLIRIYLITGTAHTPTRIIGGHKTNIEKHPWQVSIRARSSHLCGGSIIHEHYVLTAAHCLKRRMIWLYTVQVGTNNLRNYLAPIHNVSEIIVHPDYIPTDMDNDIGILKLKEPLVFSLKIHPVHLPLKNTKSLVPGQRVVLSGFGQISMENKVASEDLREAELFIFDHRNCTSLLSYEEEVTQTMICAAVPDGATDACQGDSGGPLTRRGVLFGIVSWGIGCALKNHPGVYTDVIYFRDWIKSYTNI